MFKYSWKGNVHVLWRAGWGDPARTNLLPRVATPATLPSPERECLSVQRSVVPEVRHSSVEQSVELCVRAERPRVIFCRESA